MHKVVRKSQLKEWAEAPVVEVVIQALEEVLKNAKRERADCFYAGDAHKTQEERSMWMGSEMALENIIDFLKQDEETVAQLFDEAEIEIVDEKE